MVFGLMTPIIAVVSWFLIGGMIGLPIGIWLRGRKNNIFLLDDIKFWKEQVEVWKKIVKDQKELIKKYEIQRDKDCEHWSGIAERWERMYRDEVNKNVDLIQAIHETRSFH